jgi:predicted transcriptional regulator
MSNEEKTDGSLIKLRVSPEFKKEVEEFAEGCEVSVSALTRMALAEKVRKQGSQPEDEPTEEDAA